MPGKVEGLDAPGRVVLGPPVPGRLPAPPMPEPAPPGWVAGRVDGLVAGLVVGLVAGLVEGREAGFEAGREAGLVVGRWILEPVAGLRRAEELPPP